MKKIAIDLPVKEIEKFCIKWKIKEFALFGSVLRDDFDHQKSDIDVLYVFASDAQWGWDIVTMRDELEELFKRKVDFVEKDSIEKSKNPYRKKEILDSYEVIYEQAA